MHSGISMGYSFMGTFWVIADKHLIVDLRQLEVVKRNFANTITLVTGQNCPGYEGVSGNEHDCDVSYIHTSTS